MANLVWIGGGNNRADNPKDWSPAGVPQQAPQPGNNLMVSQGTINISGEDFSNSALEFLSPGPATANISNGSSVVATVENGGGSATLHLRGDNTLSLEVGTPGGNAGTPISGTVDLAANSRWVGGFSVTSGFNSSTPDGPNGATLIVNAGNKASFINNITPTLALTPNGIGVFGLGARAIINADISGTATVRVFDGGVLEVGGAVGSGQGVILNGASALRVDHPTKFAGQVNLIGGQIDLEGLAKADSYTFQNDMLSIFSAGKMIDTLHLTDSTLNGFVVQQTAGSVNVVGIIDPNNHPIGLPLHV